MRLFTVFNIFYVDEPHMYDRCRIAPSQLISEMENGHICGEFRHLEICFPLNIARHRRLANTASRPSKFMSTVWHKKQSSATMTRKSLHSFQNTPVRSLVWFIDYARKSPDLPTIVVVPSPPPPPLNGITPSWQYTFMYMLRNHCFYY